MPLPQLAKGTDVLRPSALSNVFRYDYVCAREGARERCDRSSALRWAGGKPTAQGPQYMRYIALLNAEPAAWLLIFMVGSVMGTLLYIVLTSITF